MGDIDPGDVEFTDELYSYFLTAQSEDEVKAAIQALQALVAKYAKAMEEKVGDVEIKFKERYEGYQDLLDKYLKDPVYGLFGSITPYAGGLSFAEKRSDEGNSDLRSSPFSTGSSLRRSCNNYLAPFYKD